MSIIIYIYIALNLAVGLLLYPKAPFRVILKWHLLAQAWFFFVVLGPLGYFLARYTGIGFSIYGNDIDGFGGDAPYRNNQAKVWYRQLWPDFWWSVIRNPVHNFEKNILRVSGTISKIETTGYMHLIAFTNGKQYFFYYKDKGYLVKFGWKFWLNEIKVGDFYEAAFALDP